MRGEGRGTQGPPGQEEGKTHRAAREPRELCCRKGQGKIEMSYRKKSIRSLGARGMGTQLGNPTRWPSTQVRLPGSRSTSSQATLPMGPSQGRSG